jgi:aspartate/tyrosine/aromatic aminotransferase
MKMFFSHVPEGKPDAVFGLTSAFQADPRPNKVDLLVGIYKDEQLKTVLLPSVARAKQEILKQDLVADYMPIDGIAECGEELGKLLFGDREWLGAHGRIYAAQTVGGTGALRVAAEFLRQEVTQTIYVPDPTWPNHRQVFERAGCRVETYPYYNRQKMGFDCNAMCQKLEALPEKTAVVLHAACHNPTGRDPSMDEWKRISQVMKEKKLLPFFDCAYQGLGEGLERDADAVRLFMKQGHEMIVAYSCSKNFSLYCQRVGALFVIDENAAVKSRIGSQIKPIIRALYSNPPAHGAKIVVDILKNGGLRKEWEKELEGVRRRIVSMREELIDRLTAAAKKTDFSYLRNREGLFMFVDLTKSQVQRLIHEFGVYLLDSGRISVAGLTRHNIDYVVHSLLRVIEP